MSDLFHESVPFEFIGKVFRTMEAAYWHNFQVLTKRAERLFELDSKILWPPNVWMGVSVENQKYIQRIDYLRVFPFSSNNGVESSKSVMVGLYKTKHGMKCPSH